MMSIRKILFAAAVALGVAGTESSAQAQCSGPGCGQSRYSTLGQFMGHGNAKPTFQAAPWYLYWPYDAHFQTPAPVTGAWYGPPNSQAPANRYFPAPMPGGFGAYGPQPGYGYPPPAGYAAPAAPNYPVPAGYPSPYQK